MITRAFRILAMALGALLAAGLARADAGFPAVKTPYSGDQFIADASRQIAAHYRMDGDWDLTLTRSWNPPSLSANTWQLTILEFPSAPSSNLFIHFRLVADGAPIQDASVQLHAALWRSAWYARQPLTARSIFSASDLEARRVDVLHDRDALPATAGDDSYLLARDVPADGLLTWHDLTRRPLVRRGDVVDVIASDGALSVTMKALAMENGARGDLVTVQNLDSHKDISALVVSDNRVEVHF